MTKKIISYRLTINRPVVLSVPGGDPNSAETLTYIPGSAIAGALAGYWYKTNRVNAYHTVFRKLFLDDHVRYLNAYIEGENRTRLLPSPLSMRTRKGEPDQLYDLADPYINELLEDTDPAGLHYQYQPWREGYVRLADSNTFKYRGVQLNSAIHNCRNREMGRSIPSKPGTDMYPIFSYISLDKGEQFIGNILLDEESDAEILYNLIENKNLFLGRSKSAQYGGEAVTSDITIEDAGNFIEAGSTTINGDRFVVTLLSDYIGIDNNGHPTPEAFIPELCKQLDCTPENLEVASFIGVRPVSGYVNKWKMPRAVQPAICAGSVFVIKSKPPAIDFNTKDRRNKLDNLLWNGMGMRRVDGFGRLAINWHGQSNEDEEAFTYTPSLEILNTIQNNGNIPVTPPGLEDLAHLSRQRLVERQIEYKIVESANRISEHNVTGIPKRAFLGRLRSLLKAASSGQDISNFIRDCGGSSKPAGRNLENCKLQGVKLKDWLQKLFDEPENFFTKIGFQGITDFSMLMNGYFANIAQSQLNDADAFMLTWKFQKYYAELVLQELVRISKRGGDGN